MDTEKARKHTDQLVEILEDVSLSQRPARIVGAFYALEVAVLTHTKLLQSLTERLRTLKAGDIPTVGTPYMDRFLAAYEAPDVKDVRATLGHFIRYHYDFDLSPIELENGASSVVLALKDWFGKSLK